MPQLLGILSKPGLQCCIHHLDSCWAVDMQLIFSCFLSRPSITDVRRVGYFSSDQTTQTDNSDILELKFVTGTIGSIIEVFGDANAIPIHFDLSGMYSWLFPPIVGYL